MCQRISLRIRPAGVEWEVSIPRPEFDEAEIGAMLLNLIIKL